MRKIGSIIGYQNEPTIYVIVKRDYIYIGETQRLPVSRWGEHLCKMGSFSLRLQEQHMELAKSNDFLIYFFGYSCQELNILFNSEAKIKRNTQYIEDAIHRKFASHEMSTRLRLISDTTRTAPIRSNDDRVENISDEIFNAIIEDLSENIELLRGRS